MSERSEDKRKERRRWLQVAVCIVLIYATLGVARSVVDALRDLGLLRITVATLFVSAGVAIVVAVIRRRPRRNEVLVLLGALGIYCVLLLQLERAEERLHFLQYGLVGVLVYSALEYRWVRPGIRSDLSAAAAASVLVLAAGWIDEGIQYFLPNRVYDLRDVAFNFVAGLLAIGLVVALERARKPAATVEYATPSARRQR